MPNAPRSLSLSLCLSVSLDAVTVRPGWHLPQARVFYQHQHSCHRPPGRIEFPHFHNVNHRFPTRLLCGPTLQLVTQQQGYHGASY
eukprot:COSAG01_NODE_4868_length_4666_cov_9.157434_3_plen_86_part_00